MRTTNHKKFPKNTDACVTMCGFAMTSLDGAIQTDVSGKHKEKNVSKKPKKGKIRRTVSNCVASIPYTLIS